MTAFVHLHVHSCYSLLRGANGLHSLLARVQELGMSAVALTDVNAMYGIVPFYTAARGLGLHPVLGVEIRRALDRRAADRLAYVNRQDAEAPRRKSTHHGGTKDTEEHGEEDRRWVGTDDAGRVVACEDPEARWRSWRLGGSRNDHPQCTRVVALARTLEGYGNLCRLTTARQLDAGFDLPTACLRYQEGVYFLTDDEALLAALAEQVPAWRLFAALRPRPGRAHRDRLRRLALAARHRGLGCVATNDVFFAASADYSTHRTLRAIDHIVAQEQLDATAHDVAPEDAWLKSGAEMAAALPEWPDALARTVDIAHDCRVELPMGKPLFPEVPSLDEPGPRSGSGPAGQPPAVDPPHPGSGSGPAGQPPATPYATLRAACDAGLRRRYGPQPAPEVRARLDYELEVIDRLGFTPYFLIVHDIVRFAQRVGIPCVGRGSAADSLVTYALGIGAVDPLRYDLYFERFLNLGRTDCPDIDIDFCWRRRDDVLDYVYRTYGADRVAMICTFNTFGARSAFRDVAKTFGLPLEEIDRLASRLPHADVANIRKALEQFPECRGLPFDAEPYRTILAQAERIDGFPRHLGIHPCGIVVAPAPLTDLVPLELATKGIVVTQYDMHPIEALGLVKIDLLGQRALSIVTDAATIVRERYGHALDLDRLPEPDPRVAALARTGDTMGCFQIDSPGMRNLLQQIRAESRMDLIMALSLIRPGPAASGMKEAFVRRARGLEPVPDPDPRLTALLADTYGVLLYQEDLLRVAHVLAGFSRADADALRQAMSKKRSPRRMAELRARFLDGCAAQDVRPAVAHELWTRMSSFAGYSYCKAHACTYGHISYQGLWLKAYYPTAFYAGVLNNAAGMYAARTYLEDARRHGVAIRPVDIHASAYWTTVELVEDGNRQDAKDAKKTNGQEIKPGEDIHHGDTEEEAENSKDISGRTEACTHGAGVGDSAEDPWRLGGSLPPSALRLGLWHVAGLRKCAIDAIVAARPFAGLRDLCRRVDLERDEVEALVKCGACDAFGLTRPQLLWEVAQAFGPLQRARHAEQPLFPGAAFVDHLPPPPALPEYDPARKLEMEQAVLGLDLTLHPLAPFRAALADYPLVAARDLPHHAGRRVQVAGWLVASRRVVTKKQQYMRFVTLEDETGLMEITLFPDAYQAYGHLIRTHGPYVVTGVVDAAYGACTVTAAAVEVLEPTG